ncbi:hypothetical protein FPZ43_12940 [Mucilaginibacter pallidiroseus]|uniref:Uncharacterized protein n=1 Tax=Mucilaginibacter pallidiroseus TaxID=2599295 RepID=A0A563U7T1_9SPHI|nr:hypothetical protein [Mucilaginibacter pallidiroseus]TWR27383.1 hypothetical protein FPZ43_12940 [Mucilaginibacter pallidiroseus]
MNEIISIAELSLRTLSHGVLQLLSSELKGVGIVAIAGNQLLIKISRNDFEQRMGNLLQQIQTVIDKRFPVRTEHLSIVITDNDARYKNVFKIWKSA